MMKSVLFACCSALGVYLLMLLALYVFQRDMLYFPTPDYSHSYGRESLHNQGEIIDIVVLNPGMERAVLYFGGNAEPASLSAEWMEGMFPQHTIYLMNYRGYAASSGQPTENGILADAQALYDLVIKRHSDVSVAGRSLGTGVSTHVAAKNKVSRLMLVTPYDSVAQVAAERYAIFPVHWLIKDKFNSLNLVSHITAPTMIIAAEFDQIIPFKHTQQLIKAFPDEQLEVVIIPATNHNNISDTQEYRDLLVRFLGA